METDKSSIIAVTGLAGHALGSWATSADFIWLRDVLPKDVPDARVLLYGYNSRLGHDSANQNLATHMECFSNDLQSIYDSVEGPGHPPQRVILIGHSLGCLLISKAVAEIFQDKAIQRRLEIVGVVFFGAPHRGLEIEALLDFVNTDDLRRNYSETLIQDLKRGSSVLQQLGQAFGKAAHALPIFTVYERSETPTIAPNKDGKWIRNGPSIMMVSRDSAVLNYAKEVTQPSDQDHSRIAKLEAFSSNVYRGVADFVVSALSQPSSRSWESADTTYQLGLQLGDAPEVDEEKLVARADLLERLDSTLLPHSTESARKIAVISGLGGIGKTQLALAFAKRTRKQFSASLWINAMSRDTLRQDLVALASRVLPGEPMSASASTSASANDREMERTIEEPRAWFSRRNNGRWLLIFDNYDNPALPGRNIPGSYSLKQYFPHVSQGSILVTTRISGLGYGTQIALDKLDPEQSLDVLARRSGRDAAYHDKEAKELANRLNGLPLALATAGDYLLQNPQSFGEYLRIYEQEWNELEQHADELPDYAGRTLFSTWNMSLRQIDLQGPGARSLLTLLAYLDGQDIWLELLQKAKLERHYPELSKILHSKIRFAAEMRKLQQYCMVNSHVASNGYSVHPCVHDWAWHHLNRTVSHALFWAVVHCVAESYVFEPTNTSSRHENWRLFSHSTHLMQPDLRLLFHTEVDVEPMTRCDDMLTLGLMYRDQGKLIAAELMFRLALEGFESLVGPKHESTLNAMNCMGVNYSNLKKDAEAEKMLIRALEGYKTVRGSEDLKTLGPALNLGQFYRKQGRLGEAETLIRQTLEGYEKARGPEHSTTLDVVNSLGLLYSDQKKLKDAETMFQRALAGQEKALGPEHTTTLGVVNNIAVLYRDQGRLEKAEPMLRRVLDCCESALGPEHLSTLHAVKNLGLLLDEQEKLVEGEQLLDRAREGYETGQGLEHENTRQMLEKLTFNYVRQGKLDNAWMTYQKLGAQRFRIAAGFAKSDQSVEFFKLLLSKDFPIDGVYDQELTTLQKAAIGGSIGVVGVLLEHGANVNAVDNQGFTALMHAAYRGQTTIVALLLAHTGTDINARNDHKDSAILFAAYGGHLAVVKLLLGYKHLEINAYNLHGDGALICAAQNDHPAIVEVLLAHLNIDVNASNVDGDTALSLSAVRGHVATVKLLLNDRRIDVNAGKKFTALQLAAYRGQSAVVKLFLAHPSNDVNTCDENGSTALIVAAIGGQAGAAKLLLACPEVNVNASTKRDGYTALMRAAGDSFAATTELLLQHPDIDVNARMERQGFTALHIAALHGHITATKLLLAHPRVNVNTCDIDGDTALSAAAVAGQKSVVELLLRSTGLQRETVNKQGQTALAIARGQGHEELVALLQSGTPHTPEANHARTQRDVTAGAGAGDDGERRRKGNVRGCFCFS